MRKGSVRKFECLRCHKQSTDQQAEAHGIFADGVKWEHENLDLCKKCFKLTRKENSQTMAVKEMLDRKMILEEDLPKFQDDKQFKIKLFQELDKIHREELQKRNEKIKHISPSDKNRKESRKLLQQVRSIE